jgi:hypothetical protein
MEHTPGPWAAPDRAANNMTNGFAVDVYPQGCDAPSIKAARAFGRTAEEAESNARLIASAPDLEREVIALRAIKDELVVALEASRYRLSDAIEDSGYSVAGPTVWGAEDGYPKWVASARADIAEAGSAIEKARNV